MIEDQMGWRKRRRDGSFEGSSAHRSKWESVESDFVVD
jgi:hypothetical protein